MRHMARCAALVLLVASTPASAGSYKPPTPDILASLQRQHGRKDWWFVKVDSARYEVRVRTIDASGLSGLQPRKRIAGVPPAVAWTEIARIDERKSHFRRRQVQGVVLGGIAGFTLASLGGLQDPLPGLAVFAGAGAGGYLGALVGDSQVHEQPLYISRTLFEAPPAVVTVASDSTADSSRSAVAPDSTRGVAHAAVSPPSAARAGAATGAGIAAREPTPQVLHACEAIHPNSRLRLRADFGAFEGSVERATPEGLFGLRLASHAGASATAPDHLAWERIDRVELARHPVRTGAIGGAIGFGVLGALVGLVAVVATGAAGTGPSDSGGAWIAAGAACGAAGGALLGAAGGSMRTQWKLVYQR